MTQCCLLLVINIIIDIIIITSCYSCFSFLSVCVCVCVYKSGDLIGGMRGMGCDRECAFSMNVWCVCVSYHMTISI